MKNPMPMLALLLSSFSKAFLETRINPFLLFTWAIHFRFVQSSHLQKPNCNRFTLRSFPLFDSIDFFVIFDLFMLLLIGSGLAAAAMRVPPGTPPISGLTVTVAGLSLNPFEAMTTVTAKIVSQLTGDSDFASPEALVAFALGMTLFVITLGLNVLALYIVRKYREQYE